MKLRHKMDDDLSEADLLLYNNNNNNKPCTSLEPSLCLSESTSEKSTNSSPMSKENNFSKTEDNTEDFHVEEIVHTPEKENNYSNSQFDINQWLFNVRNTDTVMVTLANSQLWKNFDAETNEMMVTNLGRRIFPGLKFIVTGLHPNKVYCAGVHLIPESAFKQRYDSKRLKYVNCESNKMIFEATNEVFTTRKTGDSFSNQIDMTRLKLHSTPQKPSKTAEMMKKPKTRNALEMIEVKLLFKYRPVIRIYECQGDAKKEIVQTSFPETSFITVTIYKNKAIRDMKTLENKFVRADTKRVVLEKIG